MDMQARMRLKVSGDKVELRQGYIPALFPHIVKPLMEQGSVSRALNIGQYAYNPDHPITRAQSKVLLIGWMITS